jgi:hypothetical protein
MEDVEKNTEKHPNTYNFYRGYYKRLLAFQKIADRRLDQIDERLIAQFQTFELKLQKMRPATVNRGIATLRKAMRLAKRWKLIDSTCYLRNANESLSSRLKEKEPGYSTLRFL